MVDGELVLTGGTAVFNLTSVTLNAEQGDICT